MAGLIPKVLDESVQERFWAKVDRRRKNECWDWKASFTTQGYGRFKYASFRIVNAHRAALAMHTGIDPDGMFALHSCDRRQCCNPHHLRWGTASDNCRDMVIRDRHRNPSRPIVTPDVLREVVDMMDDRRMRNIDIARAVGLPASTIGAIRTGYTWSSDVAAIREGKRPIPGPVQVAIECLVKHGGV